MQNTVIWTLQNILIFVNFQRVPFAEHADFDEDLEYALQKVGNSVDSNNPDLRRLRDNGSKLIVYHGWSDPDISPVASINYYESVVDTIALCDRFGHS